MVTWTARVRMPDLTLTDPVEFTAATLVENYNQPDMLSIEGDLAALAPVLHPDRGIVLHDQNGVQRFSGLYDPTGIERRGNRTASLTLASDTQILWWRICYPNPLVAWTAQNVSHDVASGTVEARMLYYINRNIGPGAAVISRNIPKLRLPPSQGRGAVHTSRLRFQQLGTWLTSAAEQAGIRFRVVQTYEANGTPWLDLKLDSTDDLSSWARFGTPEQGGPGLLGEDWSYRVGAPNGTAILCAAGGEGAARVLRSTADTAAQSLWNRRVEVFKDQRGTTDEDEITEALAEAVIENAGAVEVSVPLGESDLTLGTDIPVGSKIGATLDGIFVVDRLRQVTTTLANTSGAPTVSVTGVMGNPDAGVRTPTQRKLAQALRRLTYLERSL